MLRELLIDISPRQGKQVLTSIRSPLQHNQPRVINLLEEAKPMGRSANPTLLRQSSSSECAGKLRKGAACPYSIDFLDKGLHEEFQKRRQKDEEYGTHVPCVEESTKVAGQINESIIGRLTLFESPFGPRAICYADYTASGRALHCIEQFIQDQVLPRYGNTHTTTSNTGLQTTSFREEAREIIARATNAKIDGERAIDCVVFSGSGTTSAVNKMVTIMGLHLPVLSENPNERPVVFVGPFEHHSNLLPWRESCADVVTIPENEKGQLDVTFLAEQLQIYANRPLKIGSFAAASNLTGLLTDVDHVSAILHMHGALAFWDYATCAPYVEIDMNPSVQGPMRPYVYKDAVFLSGHKFIGGPGSPGVLICKKRLLNNAVPSVPGGGTVFFVTKTDHRYLSDQIEREEGGTPDIIGSIRLGLAFQLKQRVHPKRIMEVERGHLKRVLSSLESNPHMVLLGRNDIEKLPIFSFLIRFKDRFLHYNFVCALLNDLFGVQTRGGCQCANPYATRILGITDEDLVDFEEALVDDQIMLRAGFSRISFPYFMPEPEVDYVLDALHFVADHGWKFLPLYRFDPLSGAWQHHTRCTDFEGRVWLSQFVFDIKATSRFKQELDASELEYHRKQNLLYAREYAAAMMTGETVIPQMNLDDEIHDDHYYKLRWFAFPSEAWDLIKLGKTSELLPVVCPVRPDKYFSGSSDLAYSFEYGRVLPVGSCETKNTQFDKVVGSDERSDLERMPDNNSGGSISPLNKVRPTSSKNPLRSTQDAPSKDHAACHFKHVQQSTNDASRKAAQAKMYPDVPTQIMTLVNDAVSQWNMIEDGDRLLISLSGSAESLALLHILLNTQNRSSVRFQIACVCVDPMNSSYNPQPLKDYVSALGLPFIYHSEYSSLSDDSESPLYSCCHKLKFNKLVLPSTLDDFCEDFFVSAIYHGQFQTMKATARNEEQDVEVIRPLIHVRRHVVENFADNAQFPVIEGPSAEGPGRSEEHDRVRRMLSMESNQIPALFDNIHEALLPFMDESRSMNGKAKQHHHFRHALREWWYNLRHHASGDSA